MADHISIGGPTLPNGPINGIPESACQPKEKHLSFLIIGTGSRGNAYASALTQSASDFPVRIGAIAEPITSKRNAFERRYVRENEPCQLFSTWQAYVDFEKERQARASERERADGAIDGVFICTLDEMHADIITALAPLGLNIMSEKPLATTLSDCLKIYRSLQPPGTDSPQAIFSIGHVLRYSPHNMLLRQILLEHGAIGDVLSIEHTEPVGWWHFSHSYVRAKRIYLESQLDKGNTAWPVNIIDPEIEDFPRLQTSAGSTAASLRLLERLSEDYDENASQEDIDQRPWFGRCVYESANDVCDDQVVTMTWEDDPLPSTTDASMDIRLLGRGAKIATFHMVASTEKQCERRGRVYGTRGEIEYDSKVVRVYDFDTKATQTHHPRQTGGGHGGGDAGLAWQFAKAIQAVQMQAMNVAEAQKEYVGCTLEEIIRSHAMVFAAEEARKERKVVNWADWWRTNVEEAVDEGKSSSSALQV